jgi:hypothetical protein
MKKGMIFLTVVVVLNMVGVSSAAVGDVDVDVTWVSKYIWRGFDILDDKAALQPSVNVDLGSGFTFNAWASLPGASKNGGRIGTVDLEEWNYTVTYAGTAFDGEEYKTDYAIDYRYYDYPDTATWDADMQEIVVGLSWPDLCEAGVVPSYTVIKMWPAKGGHGARANGGYFHIFGLGYEYTSPDLPELPLDLSWSITYNDGAGTGSQGGGNTIEHDFSHMLWGVSTSIDCPAGGTITPAVYYQVSMEDTVNKQDEFWVGVSYGLSF